MSFCQTCKWSKMVQQGTDANSPIRWLCRRYPPQIVGGIAPGPRGMQSMGESHWPSVDPDDGCGEHVITPGLN